MKLSTKAQASINKVIEQFKIGEPNFTEKELTIGFKIVWLSLKGATSKVENDKPENYEGHFIQKRDIEFLKKAEQIIQAN